MVTYIISPVNRAAKGSGIAKYQPNEEDRGGERYQPYPQKKNGDEKQDSSRGTFTESLAEKKRQMEKAEDNNENMKENTKRQAFEPQPFSPYLRARILSATLAHELTNMQMAE